MLVVLGWYWIFPHAITADEATWNQFRGRSSDGHAKEGKFPVTWGGLLGPPKWIQTLPGHGWSSPIVVDGSIWLTSAEVERQRQDLANEKLAFDDEGPLHFQTHAKVTLLLLEVDFESGQLRRRIELFSKDNPKPIHQSNSYASPTPVANKQTVFCHFGSLGTIAIDRQTGRELWQTQIEVDEITGAASSPILWSDLLIVVSDGADRQVVTALDIITGNVRWQASRPPMVVRDDQALRSFSTPVIIDDSERIQLLSPTSHWLVSYDPSNGREWWRCRTADGYSVVPQVAYRDGIAYTCTGYMKPQLWAIRTDGTGDVSHSHVVWKSDRQVPELASPIIVGQEIYTVTTQGILVCRNTQTGDITWSKRMEGSYAASPILAGGLLYLTNTQGLTTVLRPGVEYEELARNETFGQTFATLAPVESRLLIRTSPRLFCIESK